MTQEDFIIPIGSMIIPNLQPEAPLIAAMLEFDAEIKESVLLKERQVTLKNGSSIMYDTTAFNLTMMYGLPAVTVPENIETDLVNWELKSSKINTQKSSVMWVVDGIDDRSVTFAARLMEQDVQVRIIDKDAILSSYNLSRGSVAVLAMDNPNISNLNDLVNSVATDLNVSLYSVDSGFGAEELPDWGGRHFRLLNRPQIALLSHSGFSSYDVGVSWWSLDHHLGIRHSQLNSSLTAYGDLRRYNTIILPSGNPDISDYAKSMLMDWVKQGGTLIANNASSRSIISSNIGNVKNLNKTFENSKTFNFDLMRELYSLEDQIDITNANDNKANLQISYPWESTDKTYTKDQLEMRDKWQSLLMPSGAFVATRNDDEHWLTFGTDKILPVLYSNYPILMTGGSSEAVLRIGELMPNSEISENRTINWSQIPAGYDMNVRMSGLVWPEASQRIANSAYLTRERIGKGQIILFSGEPNFRGSARGTNRLWLNAVVYGSGLGTSSRITP